MWAACWALFRASSLAGAPPWAAALVGAGAGAAVALRLAGARRATAHWRATAHLRAWVVGAGFPLSLLASGALGRAAALPGWAWLVPLVLLWLLYPKRAWRDAPLFPTPHAALDGLAAALPLRPQARVLDAGCGLGHGLRALQRAYPQARLEGVEWSAPLALLARLRCGRATVRRGDLWAQRWHDFDLVYLFQRPESMARAWAKASAEMKPGAWLASLEFGIDGVPAQQVLACPDGRALWLYRLAPQAGGSSGTRAGPIKRATEASRGRHRLP